MTSNAEALQKHIDSAMEPDGSIVMLLRSELPHALAIYAFGSRVLGAARVDSDLDLAVLVEGYAKPLELWELAGKLASKVGCAVDLLDFRAASTVMQHQVLSLGRKLWAKEPNASLYECFVMSEKNALDIARADLIKDIAKEGRVYG